jgi:hypothetical protein
LIIDSLEQMPISDFRTYTYSIIISYGFLTGRFPYGEGYYFSSSNKNFINESIVVEYSVLQEGIESSYNIIYGNSYGYKHIIGIDEAERYYSQLKEVSEEFFSKVCHQIFENEYLLKYVAMMLLANSYEINNAYVIYSTVLYLISQIVQPNSFNKLIGFNQSEQILNAFDKLDIHLNIEQVDIINHKDQILLDKSFKTGCVSNNVTEFGRQYYYTLRFHNLVNKLLLKYFGFDGKMINHVKLFEKITGVLVNEDYFVNA